MIQIKRLNKVARQAIGSGELFERTVTQSAQAAAAHPKPNGSIWSLFESSHIWKIEPLLCAQAGYLACFVMNQTDPCSQPRGAVPALKYCGHRRAKIFQTRCTAKPPLFLEKNAPAPGSHP